MKLTFLFRRIKLELVALGSNVNLVAWYPAGGIQLESHKLAATVQHEDQRCPSVACRASCWCGAYYLTGYAVEFALKLCVLVRVEQTGIIFQDKKFVEKCWTHDSEELVLQAGLKIERDKAAATNAVFAQNWAVAKDWSEASRYRAYTQPDAEKLFAAINDQPEGILSWIKKFW